MDENPYQAPRELNAPAQRAQHQWTPVSVIAFVLVMSFTMFILVYASVKLGGMFIEDFKRAKMLENSASTFHVGRYAR